MSQKKVGHFYSCDNFGRPIFIVKYRKDLRRKLKLKLLPSSNLSLLYFLLRHRYTSCRDWQQLPVLVADKHFDVQFHGHVPGRSEPNLHAVWHAASGRVSVNINTSHEWQRLPRLTANKLVCQKQYKTLSLSLRFNGHFPGGPGLAGIRMFPFCILLELRMMKVVHGDRWSYKMCKAPVKSSPPANQHPVQNYYN